MPRKLTKVTSDTIYLRNMRDAGWFWIHNELVDVFAPLIGPYALAVYVCLTRRCEGNSAQTQWSLRELERVWRDEFAPSVKRPALGKTSIARAISQLVASGMIVVERPATRAEGAHYALPSLPHLAKNLTPELRERLVVRLEQLRERGVPVGDTENLLKTSGKACEEPGFSTEIPGTHVSPTGSKVSPTGTQVLKDNNTGKTPSPTPPGRRGSGFDFFAFVEKDPEGRLGYRPEAVARGRAAWVGLANDLRAHLLAGSSRNHTRDGVLDWEIFARLAVEGFDVIEGGYTLRLSSPCPGDAKHVLSQYAPSFWKLARRWFSPLPQGLYVDWPAQRKSA